MKVLLLALNAKYIHTSLALRSIKAYCKEYDEQITIFESTINNNENEIIKKIYDEKPDILGISCYIWNMSFIKILVPTLKKVLPHTTIILGGPEVSYESEELLSNLEIDGLMEGEGEETWKDYLDYRIKHQGTLDKVDGLIYKINGQIIRNNPRRPLDLKKLPFVYNNLSELEHKILYYEASRGCPFNCQYCLSSVEKGVRFVPVETVKEHLLYFCENKVKQVKFVDRTFNTKKSYAMELWEFIIDHDNGYTNFHFEIAAELIDDEMIALLKAARPGLIQFEIGVQSTNLEVLEVIKRKMPFEDIKEIVLKIKALNNIHQHLDLIAGLPLEDYTSFGKSFDDVISLRPEQFQLGFLKVLKGSGLRRDAERYGLIYKQEPPYEILYTKHISYEEILRLQSIEELVERYYNSNRFTLSLEYLFGLWKSPFKFFEDFSYFWEKQGYDSVQHNKLSYYTKLAEFCVTSLLVNQDVIKECIRFDYLMHDHLNEMPAVLQTLDQTYYKETTNLLLKDDDYIASIAPHLSALIPRQRFRTTHVEHFKYDVFKAYMQKDYMHFIKSEEPISILFDYFTNTTTCLLLRKDH